MNDPGYREILGALGSVRELTPPADVGKKAVGLVHRSLVRRRRRQRLRVAGSVCAAGILIVISLVLSHREAPIPSNAAILQLQTAVNNSNAYRGIVQVEVQEISIDSGGQSQPPASFTSFQVDTRTGDLLQNFPAIAELPITPRVTAQPVQFDANDQRVLTEAQHNRAEVQREEVAKRVRVSRSSTILIPLTWRGGTIPIPTTPIPSVQPYVIEPDQSVTVRSQPHRQEFIVAPPQAPSATSPRRATVWVDPKTGLVDQVQFQVKQSPSESIWNIKYRYQGPQANSPATTAPAK